jgi:hypothetical protein
LPVPISQAREYDQVWVLGPERVDDDLGAPAEARQRGAEHPGIAVLVGRHGFGLRGRQQK